jgi:hypothetical protein
VTFELPQRFLIPMNKGTFQSSSDELPLNESQTRPRDSQMGTKGEYQHGGADFHETNEKAIDPPYSNEGPKGTIQTSGASEVTLKKGGRDFAFSEQVSSSVQATGKAI